MEITEILGKEEFYKELSSEKPVIVDFKATWCAPCKMQTEVLKDFATTVGDKVKIISGPLTDFVGDVQEVDNENQKCKVTVSMFGRLTPVEVDFDQIEIV